MDHLYAAPVLVEYFRQLNIKDLTIVSPDVAASRWRAPTPSGSTPDLAIVDKRRSGPTETEVMHIIGDVEAAT